MSKKYYLLIIAVMVSVCLFLVSLSTFAAEEEYLIRAAIVESEDSPGGNGWNVFKEYVESQSNGRIKVEIYPASQLGGLMETFSSVREGSIQMAQGDEGAMASFYDPFLVLSIPYLFSSVESGVRFYESDFFEKEINDKLAEHTGVRIIGKSQYGFRCWTNNKRPLKDLEDYKGLKLRVMETPIFLKLARGFGASPTPISWPELYTSLRQGIADGQENPISIIWQYDIYEVQKYLTVSNHTFGVNSYLINDEFFKSLPLDLRVIVSSGAKLGAATETGLRTEQTMLTALEGLRAKGMEIYFPTKGQLEDYKNAAQPPVIEWLKGVVGDEFLDSVLKEVESIEREIEKEVS